MKKLKILFAALMITTAVGSLGATEKARSKRSVNPVRHTIQNMVQLPGEFLKQGFNENVKVLFLVNKSGQVSQVLAICPDPSLKRSVEAQFTRLSFTQFKENTLYSVNINFKVI